MSEPRITIKVDRELEDLIPDFMQRRHDEVKTLRDNLADGNLDKVRTTGHSLKGTAGGYGFDELTTLGAAIEDAANEGDLEVLERRIDDVADYLERVDVVYD